MVETQARPFPEIEELARISTWLAQKGWSEAGSGNLSIRLDPPPDGREKLEPGPPQRLPLPTPGLAGNWLLITSTGSRARETAEAPETCSGILRVLAGGEAMVCVWGKPEVTSEVAAHLAIHQMLVERRPEDRAVLHSHPASLIALTHVVELQDSHALSRALLGMQSEAHVRFPDGLRYLPYSPAGSVELATRTAHALESARVALWYAHGAVATGPNLSSALDALEYVDKMAQIYWLLRASGEPATGMRREEIEASLKHFGLWDRHQDSLAARKKASPR
jgi:rhamnulose-1-phosphate aldolase